MDGPHVSLAASGAFEPRGSWSRVKATLRRRRSNGMIHRTAQRVLEMAMMAAARTIDVNLGGDGSHELAQAWSLIVLVDK